MEELRHIRAYLIVRHFKENGKTIAKACEAVGISTATYYRWRKHYLLECGLEGVEGDASVLFAVLKEGHQAIQRYKDRLSELEERLNKLDKFEPILLAIDGMEPADKRDLIERLLQTTDLSERLLCKILHQPRSTQRYEPKPRPSDGELKAAIARLSDEYPETGYRQITELMKEEGWRIGYEKVRLLRKELDLNASPGRPSKE